MKKILNTITLSLVILGMASCMGAPKNVTPIASFDENQYLGTWYEIARLDHSFERGLEQVTANYSLREDGGIKVVNRGFNTDTKTWKEAIGKAYFIDPSNPDNTNTGRLKVSFFGPFYGAYNIIELDKPYYNYVMICGPNLEYLWILSRTPQLPYPIKQALTSKAKALGFATDDLIYVKQISDTTDYTAGKHVRE